jgi:peptidyl-prolyl cis-trans isomerase A (cyclophilin A)
MRPGDARFDIRLCSTPGGSGKSLRTRWEMRIPAWLGLFLVCGLIISAAGENPEVVIRTDLGDIRVEIFVEKAPVTAENFLRYVDGGLYADSAFYRVVRMDNQPNNEIKIEVIQGGIRKGDIQGFPPIAHETTDKTGVLHKDGIISLARSDPGPATSEFFICIGDQPELDFGGRRNPDGQGFAAFGRVIEGMDVVRRIQRQPDTGQYLNDVVPIADILRFRGKGQNLR